ncbi:hypothetical protein AA313_de0203137 [Arthrobotrys entomopaga]|nr:hypothetical protein AA313_de0203137 [Arthrobotrys entomopaga]
MFDKAGGFCRNRARQTADEIEHRIAHIARLRNLRTRYLGAPIIMSEAWMQQTSSRSTVGEDYLTPTGPVNFLFEYDLDFGREQTLIISRLQEPSEIPRPSDYVELLPVAYYISVDPRFRLVLLSPTYDTVAAISFANFQRPVVEVQELSDTPSSGNFSPQSRRSFSGKTKGPKTRFSGDSGDSFTWEYQQKDDTFELWVSEQLKMPNRPYQRKQVRKVGTMKRSTMVATDTKRIVIEADTTYISEVTMMASALTVLKRDALQERQKKAMEGRGLSLSFSSATNPYLSS